MKDEESIKKVLKKPTIRVRSLSDLSSSSESSKSSESGSDQEDKLRI